MENQVKLLNKMTREEAESAINFVMYHTDVETNDNWYCSRVPKEEILDCDGLAYGYDYNGIGGAFDSKDGRSYGVYTITQDYDWGGEGEGDSIGYCLKVVNSATKEYCLYQVSGRYDSWNGSDWEYADVLLMEPYQAVQTNHRIRKLNPLDDMTLEEVREVMTAFVQNNHCSEEGDNDMSWVLNELSYGNHELGVWKLEEVHSVGGFEGGGEHMEKVFKLTDNLGYSIYIRYTGYYNSWDEDEWTDVMLVNRQVVEGVEYIPR